MSGTGYVIVGPTDGVDRLVAAAARVSDRVVAVVVGDHRQAGAVAASGVTEVIWFDCPTGTAAEAFAPAVADIVAADPGILIGGRGPTSRVLLGAAAAAVLAPVVTGVLELEADGVSTVVTSGVYGGIARKTVAYDGPVALLMDEGGITATATAAPVTLTTGRSVPLETLGLQANTAPAADLGSARRVIGVGRGLKSKDDLPLVETLAARLRAELGCTRPLAEGLEWLPKDRYIGISGQHIAPQVYLALGVSGQLQHMAGVRAAGTIVSINSDPSAPITKDADYILVGDLYELVPAIAAELG